MKANLAHFMLINKIGWSKRNVVNVVVVLNIFFVAWQQDRSKY